MLYLFSPLFIVMRDVEQSGLFQLGIGRPNDKSIKSVLETTRRTEKNYLQMVIEIVDASHTIFIFVAAGCHGGKDE